MQQLTDAFSADYFVARDRLRQAAGRCGWPVESIAVTPRGPVGEELTMDVVRPSAGDAGTVLVVSSGLHGSEGIFGSAVQLALLEKWHASPPEGVGVVLIHALNPYGFAWTRRCNEENVDLNRNFLLAGESYEGCPPLYRRLDPVLNPRRPPSRWLPFRLVAYGLILRHGLPALMQAIAGGQYEFPHGLFFGGRGPSETLRILQNGLPRWLGGASRVLHLDFHTGLGPWATYKLLADDRPGSDRALWLRKHFGSEAVEEGGARGTAYNTRGSLGRWCGATFPDRDYVYLCAEFGTYPPLAVIGGLRAENQAHFWARPNSPRTRKVKDRLRELLNPAAAGWREEVLRKGLLLVDRALAALH